MKIKSYLLGGGAVAGVAALVWLGLSAGAGKPQRHGGFGPRPVPVLTAAATTKDVPVVFRGVGTVQAYRTVTVQPQVGGQLLSVDFREGQHVNKGDVLARIDPVTYRAQLEEAQAKLAQDKASLANARLDLKRYANLAKTNYVSKQQADQARAAVRQGEARIQSDRAAVDSAKATLGYTTIRAPISGRTGIRQVDAGNIVSASSTDIVVITRLKPIAVVFTLPAADIQRVNAAAADASLPVTALGQNDGQVLDKGHLEAVNNQVDQNTGTIKLKAVLPNAREQLWPGAFVNARLQVGMLKNATVVPAAAVQQGPNGAFVYLASEDGKARMQPVRVKQQNETEAVIASGLKPGQTVITTGFGQLTDGTSISAGGANHKGARNGQDSRAHGDASAQR